MVLCRQLRTIDLDRVTTYELAGRAQYVTDPGLGREVRAALTGHLGLDMADVADGAS